MRPTSARAAIYSTIVSVEEKRKCEIFAKWQEKIAYTSFQLKSENTESNPIKDKIRAELQKLSKDDLINIVAELTNLYVVSRVNSRIVNISCAQQCINQVQSNIQPAINGMLQELNINFMPVKPVPSRLQEKSTDDTDETDL